MKKNFRLAALAAAMIVATGAHATNGYFLPGSGFRSQGMGGVGIAFGRDSLSIASNPANAVNTGMRGDIGLGVFNPERAARVFEDPSTPVTGFGFSANVESDNKYFLVPEMGFTMPLTDRLHAGLVVVGNGGMNTNFPENFFATGSVPRDKKVGVDLNQLLVPITAAFKVNEQHAVGASLVLAATRFRAYGLDSFVNFDGFFPITSDPSHLTNQGYDYSYGAGLKFGWQGDFLDEKLTLGLVYTSRTYMTKFDKYRGLFAEQGDFDIPENYGVGIAIKPKKNLVIAADVMRINYSDVASVGNPGPCVDRVPTVGGFCIPSITDRTKELGNDKGMGFGWEDQMVYKLGIQYGVNNRLQVRAGYNYGKSPIPDDPNVGGNNAITFALLAPATVEHHYSIGFTYRANDNLEVTGTYMYAANNSQSGENLNIVDHADFNMHQNLFALSLGWVLDPGPKALGEYGEDDWAGINFDGWYAGLGIGQSNYTDVKGINSANRRAEAWKVYAGYQFNKYLGVEGGYVNLNDLSGREGNVSTEIQTDAWALSAVLSYPVTEKIKVMGKVGTAFLQGTRDTKTGTALTVRTEEDGYDPVYGVGVSYALFDNMDLRAEWDRYDRSNMNIDLVTAGFAVKF